VGSGPTESRAIADTESAWSDPRALDDDIGQIDTTRRAPQGTPNKPKVDALAAELLARAPHPPAATANALVVKRAKDTMAEFATLFAGLANAYKPRTKDENGFPVWRDNEHRENAAF
jgi:hypothetical protein